MADKPFKILSIDGGGIKGLYSANILRLLEEKSGRKSGDCFDMICGTSTGGLIALGLASGKNASELVNLYRDKGNLIFPTANNRLCRFFQNKWNGLKQVLFWGKFSAKPLTNILKETFGDTTLGELNNLVCIPSFNLISGTPRVFKYPHKEGNYCMDRDIPLVDVALSTSAAPTYLPIHGYKNYLFIDGGVWANNPTQCGLLEAIMFFVGKDKAYTHVEILSVASISQSSGWASGVRKHRSFMGWKSKLIQTSMDGQAYFTDFFLKKVVPHIDSCSKYIRLEAPKLSCEQMAILEMDRTDKKALQTLQALGERDGYEYTCRADVMHFYETQKTYKTN